ncbi:MAG: hypothetical protein J6B34_01005 [Clostridia bacterium]|nr:hypothetical protein [Clostridia bacterium]
MIEKENEQLYRKRIDTLMQKYDDLERLREKNLELLRTQKEIYLKAKAGEGTRALMTMELYAKQIKDCRVKMDLIENELRAIRLILDTFSCEKKTTDIE